jgi:hypothetical protein
LNDLEFRAEAKKAQLDIGPVTGDELTKIVNGLFKLDPTLIAKWQQAQAAK